MASSYAIPVSPPLGNYHYHHQHSHSYSPSYSSIQLSPKRERTNSFSSSNRNNGYGHNVRKAGSNGSLYTHAEVSPERGSVPPPLPNLDSEYTPASTQNESAFQTNGHIIEPPNTHTRQSSSLSMKSRPRGESDLGRSQPIHHGIQRAASTPSGPRLSMPEALTSILIPLPFFFASAAFYVPPHVDTELSSVSAFAKLQHSVLEENGIVSHHRTRVGSAWIDTCILTSGTLLLVGCLAKMRASTRSADQRKDKPERLSSLEGLANMSALRTMTARTLSVGLPFYAATHVGGAKTGLILLVSYAASRTGQGRFLDVTSQSWKQVLNSRLYTLSVMIPAVVLDLWGTTSTASTWDVCTGYAALAGSMLAFASPLPTSATPNRPMASRTPSATIQPSWNQLLPVSPLIRTVDDINLTLIAGAATFMLTAFAAIFFSNSWNMTAESAIFNLLAVACSLNAIYLSRPASLHSRHKAGLGLGCGFSALFSVLFPSSSGTGTVINCFLAVFFYISVCIDTRTTTTPKLHDHHDHDHAHNTHEHKHQHSHSEGKHSAFTQMILGSCEPGSLVHDIVSEKDSRRIAYFTLLNFGFMLVQGAYGYLSGSLGLLSDTVHMFFDCLGLIVGLGAAVAAKWPTSPEKPYGWGKLNTLAGFGNGIFLMLVSVEFVWEAIEGMLEHRELRHVQELLVVSTLGLLVNMVGLFAFGHAHAGHDHGHGHGHGHSHGHSHDHAHSHSHGHEHSHSHSHGHEHSHSHADSHSHSHSHDVHHSHDHSHSGPCTHPLTPLTQTPAPPSHSHAHAHDHDNENMHGIFLHVAADAGGSLAVIISTALTLWKPWYLWDPLATILIAVLIFAAAVPLVTSSGQKLLLVVPAGLEYGIKNTLQELGELRGVVGYAVPRFWVDDKDCGGGDGGHPHGHGHGHEHGHGHDEGASTAGREKVLGVIHVVAAQAAGLEDVRRRVEGFVRERNMDLVVQVEREGEGHELCWCSAGPKSG